MHRLLTAVLLCHASVSFASSDGALGEIMLFQVDQIARATVGICTARDPDNAKAINDAFLHWATNNRAVIEDLISGREKLLNAYRERATEPGSKAAMEERVAKYTGLQLILAGGQSQALIGAAKMTDAKMRESCAATREYWMRNEPDPELPRFQATLHKMLTEVEKSK